MQAIAQRKIKNERLFPIGERSERATQQATKVIKMQMSVQVTNIEWDQEISEIRVNGKNQTECDFVKLGASHTLEISVNRAVMITKDEWDLEHVRRFRQACDRSSNGATICAMLISDIGECRVFLCGGTRTTCVAKIERAIPKKKGAGAVVGHEKAIQKFYDDVCDAIVFDVPVGNSNNNAQASENSSKTKRHFLENCNCFVVAGPGFGKENVLTKLNEKTQKKYSGKSFENWLKSQFDCVLVKNVRASSAHLGALLEALKDPSTRKAVGEAAETLDADVLEQLYEEIQKYKALYGPSHVLEAFKEGAIKTLLFSDDVFRTKDPIERKLWTKVRERVENSGFGSARIFSTGHESGERLKQLTGVAAILRFPMENLIEQELEPPDYAKWLIEIDNSR